MSQHLLLTAKARTMSLKAIFRMKDDEAHATFMRSAGPTMAVRWSWAAAFARPELWDDHLRSGAPEACYLERFSINRGHIRMS